MNARWLPILLLVPLLLTCQNKAEHKGAVVALYSDKGCWDESIQAAEKMFQWMGYSVERVDADYINTAGLSNFKLLCIPGGDMYQYSQDISSRGKLNINNFISEGGGYIGICGGAYFAGSKVVWKGNELSMTPLSLFSGTARGPLNEIVPYPNYGMCKVDIVDTTHVITASESTQASMLYYWGPALLPDDSTNLKILGRYDTGNQPMMLAVEYGQGRAFLIGTHPEIEEDSDRDGVTFADELNDEGSDWEFMKNAARWCLKEVE
jgi:glutamine amidotransferase-like uncharacterized protein